MPDYDRAESLDHFGDYHDFPDYRGHDHDDPAVKHDDDDRVTVAKLLDSLDNDYRDWDNLTRNVDVDVFASFTRIADALEDHRTRRARLTPDERAEFNARTRSDG